MSYNNTPVSPFDPTHPTFKSQRRSGLPDTDEKGVYTATRSVRSSSDSSENSVNGQGRRTRFAEDTSVVSPASGPGENRGPFAARSNMASNAGAKPSDFGLSYYQESEPVEQQATVPTHLNASGQPLKSALKTPGTARFVNPLSPTFKEEMMLEREEEKTEKQQANDVKIKARVRLAKMLLRGVSFSCSLIVLAMLSTVLTIFRTSVSLPNRNGLPAWAKGSSAWPQIVVLVIACVSLLFSIIIIAAYCRPGGHRRAEKVAVYYTMFAVGYFIFSIVMWLVGAAVLQGTKSSSNGTDIWGWSCKDNKRSQLFQQDVHYALVCRLQDWSLICCIIEIVVELIVIAVYAVVFYRFYSKNKLRKSMNARDQARSDLYLAQLRSQSAPNTPGFAMTPRTPGFPTINTQKTANVNEQSLAEQGESPTQFANPTPTSAQTSSPFRLQAPPIKSTPRVRQDGFEQISTAGSPNSTNQEHEERQNTHQAAAPGEQVYDAVPIPGAYAGSQQHRGPTY